MLDTNRFDGKVSSSLRNNTPCMISLNMSCLVSLPTNAMSRQPFWIRLLFGCGCLPNNNLANVHVEVWNQVDAIMPLFFGMIKFLSLFAISRMLLSQKDLWNLRKNISQMQFLLVERYLYAPYDGDSSAIFDSKYW